MGYDPVQAEKNWRNKPRATRGNSRIPGEKHHLPHRLVRLELSSVLEALGCRKDSTVLDIGCGSGEDVEYVARVSDDITGVDISEEAIDVFCSRGYKGIVADVKILPFENESFEYVLCPAVLHHLKGQGKLSDYISEFTRVARQGGYLIALEPNAFNISGMLMNIANTIKPGVTGLVPHERALSPLSLKKDFKAAGLTNVRCIAASYTWNRFPLCVSRAISKYEGHIKYKRPFAYLGWFSIVYGQKVI